MWFVSELLGLVIMIMLALLWGDIGRAERQLELFERVAWAPEATSGWSRKETKGLRN